MFTTDVRLRGSVTVYCSLVLLLVAALVGAMLESAHQTGVRSCMTAATANGLDSLFSMYDQGLYEQYGLLFLNENLLDENIKDQLFEYISWSADPNEKLVLGTPQLLSFEMADVELTQLYYANDDKGIFFQREVLELMKYQETASLANILTSYITHIRNADRAYEYVVESNDSYEDTDWGEVAKEASGEDGEGSDSRTEADASETESFSDQDVEESLDGSIITQVQELLTETLLALFVDDTEKLSDKVISPELEFGADHGIAVDDGVVEGAANTVLFDEYIMTYMDNYLSPSKAGGLAYEVEYIINGAASDQENLLSVLTQILLIRMGLNIVFLLSNKGVGSQAAAMAKALVGWTGLAALVLAVKLMIIAVWAFCESVLDIRTLLSGKKVPFFKKQATFTTGAADCVSQVAAGNKAKADDAGIGYEMYLRLLLFMNEMNEKTLRCMNEIQLVMDKTRSQKFSFAECIYGAETTVTGISRPVFSGLYGIFAEEKRYEYKLAWCQTY